MPLNALYGSGYLPDLGTDSDWSPTTADILAKQNAMYRGPGGMLRSAADWIPENTELPAPQFFMDPRSLSARNMAKGGLNTMANWIQGTPQTEDMIAPMGGTMLAAPVMGLRTGVNAMAEHGIKDYAKAAYLSARHPSEQSILEPHQSLSVPIRAEHDARAPTHHYYVNDTIHAPGNDGSPIDTGYLKELAAQKAREGFKLVADQEQGSAAGNLINAAADSQKTVSDILNKHGLGGVNEITRRAEAERVIHDASRSTNLVSTHAPMRDPNTLSETGTLSTAGHSANVPLPSPTLAGRLRDQQGHTPASSRGSQGPEGRVLPVNDQLSGASELPLAAAVRAALDDPNSYYGIRVTEEPLRVGDRAPESRQWYQDYDSDARLYTPEELAARYPDHNEPLGGTSTVGLTSANDLDAIRQNANNYFGNHMAVVRGKKYTHGNDPGEWVIPDAEVVAAATRKKFGDSLFADNAKASLPGNLINAMGESNRRVDAAGPRDTAAAAARTGQGEFDTEGNRLVRGPSTRQQAKAHGAEPSITAYHGSPHDFDKFSMDKIGTGEGAQAYGHGLYFAENEGVAKSYRDTLAARQNPSMPDGSSANMHDPLVQASTAVERHGSRDAAIKAMEELQRFREESVGGNKRRLAMSSYAFDQEILDALKSNAELPTLSTPGRMYEVRIKADPEHFLDWDKPLAQQPAKVLDALGLKIQSSEGNYNMWEWTHGGRTYTGEVGKGARPGTVEIGGKSLGDLLGDSPETAKALSESGIPGIRYKDAGSRGQDGAGTRNYVVFDAQMIEILKKYGLVGALGAGALAQDNQQ